jgi:pyruvate ferredoxin oxidoreductase delta subunit
VSKVDEWKSDEFPLGACIPAAGNSDDYPTGGWRSEQPWRDAPRCNDCLYCWVYCPDSSVRVADEKFVEFDLDHCKGCGVCAQVCPQKCIEMFPEGCDLPEVK